MRDVKREAIPTDQICDKCGKPMVLKWGRFGQFLACSGYPDCKNTREVVRQRATSTPTTGPRWPPRPRRPRSTTAPNPLETERRALREVRQADGACAGDASASSSPARATPTARRRAGSRCRQGRHGRGQGSDVLLDEECPRCQSQLALKQGRFGEFTACSDYPKLSLS